MRVYKPIKVSEAFDIKNIDYFTSLFSDECYAIKNANKYICVRYNPDIYNINQEKIAEFFSKDLYKPLTMTNYKFLYLLLEISKSEVFKFVNFEFKFDGEEAEIEKMQVKEMIEDDVKSSFEFLNETGQKISYIDFDIFDKYNSIRIFSSGNIGVSNRFNEEYNNILLNLIEFLFTGKGLINNEG
ncbi:hypothetical protein LZ480_07835 [Solibacillus sp. MA9]|uniref:Uncharacterized protein n=1 Tax=Solibacillus palustris TaxID=2908203 RepID=A0ABS9UCW2_9BACL|nr:hypothetical protein [Solibacillus sp. MA9]MCH7321803.1 hypothetical protein [Solibacillus sp. MA9]